MVFMPSLELDRNPPPLNIFEKGYACTVAAIVITHFYHKKISSRHVETTEKVLGSCLIVFLSLNLGRALGIESNNLRIQLSTHTIPAAIRVLKSLFELSRRALGTP